MYCTHWESSLNNVMVNRTLLPMYEVFICIICDPHKYESKPLCNCFIFYLNSFKRYNSSKKQVLAPSPPFCEAAEAQSRCETCLRSYQL